MMKNQNPLSQLVGVVNPRRVRDFAAGIGRDAETDLIDARVIAFYGQIGRQTISRRVQLRCFKSLSMKPRSTGAGCFRPSQSQRASDSTNLDWMLTRSKNVEICAPL